ncbi:uncharacterized protein PITG_11975 [Phytophthora infestans T30-4]|uniref:Uncharacterized protein n=1 Tax=Phytophthora infestans (strain T30-4) TaxID=403677 RepID=D0NHN4_PHYIT|nr:uncharacterized protein PITG_11975 [Phytophthora infestans T30-4]EEY58959.1 conserved hypothetical protein [Phytophthora infestans T30-4]|eukprot:XP_002901432.1 conserved hypothetical protein [Phytophthora infestans T30-4]
MLVATPYIRDKAYSRSFGVRFVRLATSATLTATPKSSLPCRCFTPTVSWAAYLSGGNVCTCDSQVPGQNYKEMVKTCGASSSENDLHDYLTQRYYMYDKPPLGSHFMSLSSWELVEDLACFRRSVQRRFSVHNIHTILQLTNFHTNPPTLKLTKAWKRSSSLSCVGSFSNFPPSDHDPDQDLSILAMVARVVAKKGSVWFSDPSTYPLLAALGVATVMCAATGVRHLTTSPDVKWDRDIRKHPDMALKDRSEWRSHRKYISSLHSNAVNAYHDK